VLLSGGIDSSVLLARTIQEGRRVVPFYVRTGCLWEASELAAVRRFLAAVAADSLAELVLLDMSVADLYDGHWSMSGQSVPDQSTPDEAVYLPGRNPLLLLKPALWCRMKGIRQLAIATLANNPFDDARPEFFRSFEEMLRQSTGDRVEILRPFEHLTKRDVMEHGRELPLALTFSCIAPAGGLHCGQCNKCAERRAAFHQLRTGDPTQYAAASSLR
jgi:7-cyano-7-deazaguanine synthase